MENILSEFLKYCHRYVSKGDDSPSRSAEEQQCCSECETRTQIWSPAAAPSPGNLFVQTPGPKHLQK